MSSILEPFIYGSIENQNGIVGSGYMWNGFCNRCFENNLLFYLYTFKLEEATVVGSRNKDRI